MTIEATLSSIDATLKALLLIAQTGAAAPAELGAAPAAEKPATRSRKADAKAAAPVYWVIEKHNTVYEQKPGDPAPSIEGAVQVTEAEYQVKKEEFAKKINDAAAQPNGAAAGPSATATADAASKNSDAGAASDSTPAVVVDFKTVVERLTVLSKDTRPGKGREGILAILNKHLASLPEAERKVPKLEALKINAQLVEEVNAALADTPADADIFG